MIRNSWYVAGFSNEFATGEVQGHTITGRPIVMWRASEGAVVALEARCAHKRFPLWEGTLLEGDRLECAYHGFTYDTEGACVFIPALRDRSDRIPRTARLTKYPVVEQDGLVWVWPGEPAKAGTVGVPRTPEVGSADWDTENTEPMHVKASYRLLIENLLDLTHFYPLHSGNIGSVDDAAVPMEIQRGWRRGLPTLKTIRTRRDFTFPPMTSDRFGVAFGDQIQTHEMIGPCLFHVVIRVAAPGGLDTADAQGFVMYQTITPIDEQSHVWRRSISCPAGTRWAKDPSRSLVAALMEGAPTVVQQDRWAIEVQQQMFDYPDEGYREVNIKTDGAVVMARRILDDLEAAERRSGPAEDGHMDAESAAQHARSTSGPGRA